MSVVDARGNKRKSFTQGKIKVATGVGQGKPALFAAQKNFEERFCVVILAIQTGCGWGNIFWFNRHSPHAAGIAARPPRA